MVYTKEHLEKAAADVEAKILSIREASHKYNVPKSTIGRYCNKNTKPIQSQPGHPTLFSEQEEEIFIAFCPLMWEWGSPLDTLDLRLFAQRYLNKLGKNIYR